MRPDLLAGICRELNRTICRLFGDDSMPPWGDAPTWQRESGIAGVTHAIAAKDCTPEDLHRAWMEHKLADGWKFGDVKDAEAKTHPCLRPYLELPAAQRLKDHVFLATVRALADAPDDPTEQPKAAA